MVNPNYSIAKALQDLSRLAVDTYPTPSPGAPANLPLSHVYEQCPVPNKVSLPKVPPPPELGFICITCSPWVPPHRPLGRPAYAQPLPHGLSPSPQVPGSMAFVTDNNRPQPLWQPPPNRYPTATGPTSEVPCPLMHPWGGGGAEVKVPGRPPGASVMRLFIPHGVPSWLAGSRTTKCLGRCAPHYPPPWAPSGHVL